MHNCSSAVLICVLKACENHGNLHVDCTCAAFSTHSLSRVARATWSLEFPQFWVLNLARGHYSCLGSCPKTCFPYSHYPKHIFSLIVGVWAQDREWRLWILFVVLMDSLYKWVSTTESYGAESIENFSINT